MSAISYSLPTASPTVIGGIKVGTGLSITGGVLSATGVVTTDASLLTSGTLPDARLSGVIPRNNIPITLTSALASASGTDIALTLQPTINQSGTAAYTGIYVNAIENTVGSSAHYLLQLALNGSPVFNVDTSGNVSMSGALPATSLSGTLNAGRLPATAAQTNLSNTFTKSQAVVGPINGVLFQLTNTAGQAGFLMIGNTTIVSAGTNITGPAIGITQVTPATANYGLVSAGGGPWDGSTAGFFAGSASGTSLAVNTMSGFTGNLVDLQVAGVSKFSVSNAGNLAIAGTMAATLLSGTLADARLSANVPLLASNNTFTTAGSAAASGIPTLFAITPTVTQSGTAGYTSFLVNTTQTSTGSGSKLLADFQVGGASKFNIDNTGSFTSTSANWNNVSFLAISNTLNVAKMQNSTQTGGIIVVPINSISLAMAVKGVASQTADLMQWQDSAAHVQFGIMNSGTGVAPVWALRVRATANAESMAQTHTIGAATGKAIQVFDDAGTSLGWIPLYA